MLEATTISLKRDGHLILDQVSITLQRHEVLGIIGPNGAGKSSLLSICAGLLTPTNGKIVLKGNDLTALKKQDIARIIAVVEQQADAHERIDVRQAVEIGRTPHKTMLSPWSLQDEQALQDALNKVDMSGFEKRLWTSLSGGEKQRIHIARALAQKPEIMILDEPTNHLDIGHQLDILALIRQLDLSVMIALHDLNHAAMFCDRIAVLAQGKLMALGTPKQVLTSTLIESIFKAKADIHESDDGFQTIRYYFPACRKRN